MSRRKRVHRLTNATLYADLHVRFRVVQRLEPEYAEVKAHTLLALLRTQPGYSKAASGKNKLRIRWFLRAVPRLPHEAVLQYLPPGCLGAVRLLKTVLPPRCTGIPKVSLEQLCVLVLELAPMIEMQHSL